MPTTLNKAAYQELIDGNIEWLLKQPRSLERHHIEVCLVWCREHNYSITELTEQLEQAKARIAELSAIVDKLRNSELTVTRWEADEYIMLFDGKPIGSTFGGGDNRVVYAWDSIKAELLATPEAAAEAALEQAGEGA